MTSYLDKVRQKSGLSRRSFIKATAAATAALAVGGNLASCANKVEPAKEEAATAATEGTWVTAACWHNCGGRCLNKALVKDGVVIRQKTDDTHEDSPDYPQQRGCLRGRSQRKQVFAEDRLKYPMKRKSWQPGGGENAHGELRGEDEWERISWDEALDYVANEIKRIKSSYGNSAIIIPSWLKGDEACWTHELSESARVLALYGGYTCTWGTASWGNWAGQIPDLGIGNFDSINDRIDLLNSETVILLGSNPAWTSMGSPSYLFSQVRDAGAKFIVIDPSYTESASLLEAEWMPVRPATDIALLLGAAYVMLEEDDPETNPLIDWEFLDRCTIGFDADHMPEGSDSTGNYKDYVLGTYDGIPKTPEWASSICGTPVDQIRELGRALTKERRVALLTSWAPARTSASDCLPQAIMTLGAMGGHYGKSGHMTGVSAHYYAGNAGPGSALVNIGSLGIPWLGCKIPNPCDDCINDHEVWPAIVNGTYKYTGAYGDHFHEGRTRSLDIHMIYHCHGNSLQTREGMNIGIEAHKKVDFVCCHAQFMTTSALYSDIILPITTLWEREGGFSIGNREMAIMHSRVVEPLFEARDEYDIAVDLGKRLGFEESDVFPHTFKQELFNQAAQATVVKDDGTTYEPLCAITEDDIKAWGVEGTPQEGRISLSALKEQGIYQVPRSEGDNLGYIAFKDFVENPEANPLSNSESGKLEIYCNRYANKLNGLGWKKIDPIASYIPAEEGYEESFSDYDQGIKGEYPYQMVNCHYPKRSHTVFNNIQQLSEAFSNPVFINPADAHDLGLETGDAALLSSQHGQTLRTVSVTELFMPGVVGVPHGSWLDIDKKTGFDTGGADNMLCGPIVSAQGASVYNTCLLKIEKYDVELVPDAEKPLRIIEA